jgi:hypothetical protein
VAHRKVARRRARAKPHMGMSPLMRRLTAGTVASLIVLVIAIGLLYLIGVP